MNRRIVGLIACCVLFATLSAGPGSASAAPAKTHTVSLRTLCNQFAGPSYNSGMYCNQSGAKTKDGRIFHYQMVTTYWSTTAPRYQPFFRALRSTCKSLSLTWASTKNSRSDYSYLRVTSDGGTKSARVRGGSVGKLTVNLTGTHAFIIAGSDRSPTWSMQLAGSASCTSTTGR